MSAQRGSELGRQRDQPCAVARLGRHDRALDDRAAHLQMRCRPVEDEVAPAQPDRLRDPQPGRGEQLKQRPPLRRYLVEQAHELRPRQKAPLARRPCATRPPPRQHDLLDEVPAKWRPLFELLAATGLRISEAIGLRWSDLVLDGPATHLRVRRAIVKGATVAPKVSPRRAADPAHARARCHAARSSAWRCGRGRVRLSRSRRRCV